MGWISPPFLLVKRGGDGPFDHQRALLEIMETVWTRGVCSWGWSKVGHWARWSEKAGQSEPFMKICFSACYNLWADSREEGDSVSLMNDHVWKMAELWTSFLTRSNNQGCAYRVGKLMTFANQLSMRGSCDLGLFLNGLSFLKQLTCFSSTWFGLVLLSLCRLHPCLPYTCVVELGHTLLQHPNCIFAIKTFAWPFKMTHSCMWHFHLTK